MSVRVETSPERTKFYSEGRSPGTELTMENVSPVGATLALTTPFHNLRRDRLENQLVVLIESGRPHANDAAPGIGL